MVIFPDSTFILEYSIRTLSTYQLSVDPSIMIIMIIIRVLQLN